MYNVFLIDKLHVFSVYYEGVESTDQYSWVILNRLLFYSYSNSFLDKYFYSTRTIFYGR